ncbi:MAG: hypothetical protein ACXWRE_10185 [Pseudobdellovibrionaceae bacterium]
MKRSREFFLWAFFLTVCFWAGYLKGFLPLNIKQSLFIKGPIKILNASPLDFPPAFIKALEEDFGQKIEVQRIKDWDEVQAKMVTKNGAHLLFAPSFWAQDLSRESLILKLTPLQAKIERRLSPDFISLQDKSGLSLNVLPLYWTVTEFLVHKESSLGESLEQALQSKLLSELHLYPDTDLMTTHLNSWAKNPSIGSLKLKNIESFRYNSLPSEISKTAIWEVPRLVKMQNTRSLSSPQSKALVIYGMMIPKNSLNRKTSYRLLERLLDPELEGLALAKFPLGSTLQLPEENTRIEKDQRSSELRDLKLHELVLLNERLPDLFRDYWQKYNFILSN